MAKNELYQLSKLQVGILRQSAADDFGMMAVLEPLPGTDDEARIERLKRERQQAQDLIDLGLFKDVSAGHLSAIEEYKQKNGGRGHIIMQITEIGRLMFDYCDDPSCTAHKPGDPAKRLPC